MRGTAAITTPMTRRGWIAAPLSLLVFGTAAGCTTTPPDAAPAASTLAAATVSQSTSASGCSRESAGSDTDLLDASGAVPKGSGGRAHIAYDLTSGCGDATTLSCSLLGSWNPAPAVRGALGTVGARTLRGGHVVRADGSTVDALVMTFTSGAAATALGRTLIECRPATDDHAAVAIDSAEPGTVVVLASTAGDAGTLAGALSAYLERSAR